MKTERITEIENLTGLQFCDENCHCGQNSQEFKTIPGKEIPEWVPGWMNCVDLETVERWLVANGHLAH